MGLGSERRVAGWVISKNINCLVKKRFISTSKEKKKQTNNNNNALCLSVYVFSKKVLIEGTISTRLICKRLLSFLLSFSRRERPLFAGKFYQR